MGKYIHRIKQLVDDLKSKGREYPKDVLLALVLSGLPSEYRILVSNINQSLRMVDDIDKYDMDVFFANLIDEANRLDKIEPDTDTAFLASLRSIYKNKKNLNQHQKNKIYKKQYCTHCHRKSHTASGCYFLYPNKAPKGWVHRAPNQINNKSDQDKPINDQRQDLLISQDDDNIKFFDMEFDHDTDLVYISSHNDNIITDLLSERYVDSGVEGLERGKDEQANGCHPTLCKR